MVSILDAGNLGDLPDDPAKLPDALTDAQKDSKVSNLLQQLDRDGVIENVGKHRPGAVWALKS